MNLLYEFSLKLISEQFLSLSSDSLNMMLYEFCENHPDQVNSVENKFANN